MTESLAKTRVKLPGISARAFEHPADRAALTALRKVPGFDSVMRAVIGLLGERSLRAIYLGSSVKVNERQFKKLYALYRECLEVLDVPDTPDLFVSQTPFVNAGAVGADQPFIVMNSGTLSLLDEDEQRFILGHELGHIMADHVLYKTLLMLLLRLSIGGLGIPLSRLALYAIIGALLEWDRKSELTCDRAGMLCCQDAQVGYRVFMKLAGGSATGEMDLSEFERQAEEYKSGGSALDSIYKLLNLMGQVHPFHVLRLSEIKSWATGGEYQKILNGEYARRGENERPGVSEELKKTGKTYAQAYAESQDPLIRFLRDKIGLFRKGSKDRFD